MPGKGAFTFLVAESDRGHRLDQVVAARLAACSRSYAAELVRNGRIRVNGMVRKPGYRIRTGDEISGAIPPPEPVSFKPEPISLAVLYEDDQMMVVNKPAGLVVHPAPGNYSGTLVNALLHHCPDLAGIGGALRPGIVHRLDKDTSGTLVVAKNDHAHQHLSAQFKSRSIEKSYLALVQGCPASRHGKITYPIGRHPVERKKMSIVSRRSRSAETHWQVKRTYPTAGAALLELDIKTGRTHQIRVHCAAIGHPVIGDGVYGGRRKAFGALRDRALAGRARRQMLHAWKLGLTHPVSGRRMGFESPVPEDMQALIDSLSDGEKERG